MDTYKIEFINDLFSEPAELRNLLIYKFILYKNDEYFQRFELDLPSMKAWLSKVDTLHPKLKYHLASCEIDNIKQF